MVLPGSIRVHSRVSRATPTIEPVEPWFCGTLKVRLRGGTEFEISRRQTQIFRERTSLRAAYVSCRKISNGG